MDVWDVWAKNKATKSPCERVAFLHMVPKQKVWNISISISVRSNLAIHLSDTPFAIRQPIQKPRLLERIYKPIRTPH